MMVVYSYLENQDLHNARFCRLAFLSETPGAGRSAQGGLEYFVDVVQRGKINYQGEERLTQGRIQY